MMSDERGGTPQAIGSLVNSLLGEKLNSAHTNQQALALWLMVNGERERVHTVGVFVNTNVKEGQLPALIVYVDSNACVVDFRACSELYLARLEGAGLKLSSLSFKLSRYAQEHQERRQQKKTEEIDELPELTAEEICYVDNLVKDLPEHLRLSVSKAISTSIKREKAESTQNN